MGNGNGDMIKYGLMLALLTGGVGTNAAQWFGVNRPAVAAVAVAVEAEAVAVRATQAVAATVSETMGDANRWREEFKICQDELRSCWRTCGATGPH